MTEPTLEELQSLNDRIQQFDAFFQEAEKRRPYFFNAITELRANENAHSRLLGRLLNYKEGSAYPFLQSYLSYFGIEEKVKNPNISVEKDRIDVCIIDDEYAIIIENKIHDAVDQIGQIERYIDTISEDKTKYVQYLSKYGYKEPSTSSLSDEMKKELGDRFSKISYAYDIIDWIENHILPICKVKDKMMVFSLEVYLDHLKRLTNQSPKTKIDKEVEDKIKEILRADGNVSDENKAVLEEINKVSAYLNELEKYQKTITNDLRNKFISSIYDGLNKAEWSCMINDEKCDINSCLKDNFKIQHKDEFHDAKLTILIVNNCFLIGIYYDREKDFYKNLENKFEGEMSWLNSNQISWLVRSFCKLEYNGKDIQQGFYNPDYNPIFINDFKNLVHHYLENINIVLGKWKPICQSR